MGSLETNVSPNIFFQHESLGVCEVQICTMLICYQRGFSVIIAGLWHMFQLKWPNNIRTNSVLVHYEHKPHFFGINVNENTVSSLQFVASVYNTSSGFHKTVVYVYTVYYKSLVTFSFYASSI